MSVPMKAHIPNPPAAATSLSQCHERELAQPKLAQRCSSVFKRGVLEHWLRQGCSVPPLVQNAGAAEMPPLAAGAALPRAVFCSSAWFQGCGAALQVWAIPMTFCKSETVNCFNRKQFFDLGISQAFPLLGQMWCLSI